MRTLLKSAAVVALLLGGSNIALAQRAAPANNGPVVPGLGVWSVNGVISQSNAFKVAQQQTPITYKATIDAIQARSQQIQTQLQTLAEKINREKDLPAARTPAGQNALQQQIASFQSIQANAEQELGKMREPLDLSNAYVMEQIQDKLTDSVKAAMAKRNVSILLPSQNGLVAANTAYSMNQAIIDELNTALPSAQLVPPAGWEPREVREQKAAQAAQQGAAAPAAPARPSTDGR